MPDVKDARIAFDSLPWESPLEGMRVKRFERDGRSIRLVEFSDTFVEPGWCEKGHSGVVLQGAFALEYADGRREQLSEGDGLYIPATLEGRHKAVVPKGGRTLLLLVDG
jgi:hypothetical protein